MKNKGGSQSLSVVKVSLVLLARIFICQKMLKSPLLNPIYRYELIMGVFLEIKIEDICVC